MSVHSTYSLTIRERISGKWQIPACLLSTMLVVAAVVNIESPERRISAEEHLRRLEELNQAGLFSEAAQLAEDLSQWEDLDEAVRAPLYLGWARAVFGDAERSARDQQSAALAVVDKYEEALAHGAVLDASDFAHLGSSLEKLKQYRKAVEHHAKAAELAEPPALSHRRRVIELSASALHTPADEIDELLAAFIADAHDSPGHLIWALGRRLELLADADRRDEIAPMLAEYQDHFVGTPLQAEYDYLLALSRYNMGEYDETERLLRHLLNGLSVADPVSAKAGWLLGRVVLNDGRAQRPQEAIAIFDDVIAARGDEMYVAASRLGVAEALAELLRFEDALAEYQRVVESVRDLDDVGLVSPKAIRTSLAVVSERSAAKGRLPVALAFMKLAEMLVDDHDVDGRCAYLARVGDLAASVARERLASATDASEPLEEAEREELSRQAGEHFDEAATAYLEVSRLSTLNEQRASAAMWTAATLFDEGGNHAAAIEILQAFVRDRGDAEIIPHVLLRLGRSLAAEGRFLEAIEAYERNVNEFPRSPFASASIIPLAECYLALGTGYEEQVETTLKRITENSELFTPEAPEFRDAMFLLGSLYGRRGDYEEAISILDETLQNYPDDPRVPQARFLEAEAYRKSAMALKEEMLQPEFVGESKRLQAEYRMRLDHAAALFRGLTESLEKRDESALSPLQQVYLRDARLGEAACLFEKGEYREALALYERAAWIYKDSTAALGAYVQVINCYTFLGREKEAESALRRAQYLVKTIPDEGFVRAGGLETRKEWERYFNWVSDSLLND